MKMKSQRGAATLYVLIAMLFLTAIAISVFITSANKQQMQLDAIRATQKLYDTGETASQAYLKYMGGDVVPISNANELLQAGSGNTVYVEGKTYVFDTDKLYVLKDDITLQEEDKDIFAQLQQKLSDGTVVIEAQGYTISLIVGGIARIYSGNDNFQDYVGNQYTLAYNTQEGSTAPEGVTQGSKDFTITDVVPTKTGYVFNGWNTEQDGSGTRYKAGDTITISENTTLYAQWVIEVTNFDYVEDQNGTGYAQTFIVPATGTYMLETWGAQGGDYTLGNGAIGGYGAYSKGSINFVKDQEIYIYVGGKGQSPQTGSTAARGGYNGGGNGSNVQSWSQYQWTVGGAGGGGATDMRSTQNDLNSRFIIAGGGGGAGANSGSSVNQYNPGGSGGGISGNNGNGKLENKYSSIHPGTGGNQTAAGYANGSASNCGALGVGGSNNWIQSAVQAAGGGGGYYGGGPGMNYGASGGGGSGYIGNSSLTDKHMTGYNVQTSSEESTRTITTTNVSQTPISDYAKQGNGYARITFLHGED